LKYISQLFDATMGTDLLLDTFPKLIAQSIFDVNWNCAKSEFEKHFCLDYYQSNKKLSTKNQQGDQIA